AGAPQPRGVRQGRERVRLGATEAGTAAAIVRVLQAKEARRWLMDVWFADRCTDLLRLHAPVRRLERAQLQSTDDRRARDFRMENMTLALDEHFLTRLGMAEQGAEITHRPARHEEG